ncbi:MAG: hypothetical protein ACRDRG_05840 [Pseudonocardiaceae bacterium]
MTQALVVDRRDHFREFVGGPLGSVTRSWLQLLPKGVWGMVLLVERGPGEAHLFGWYLGFAITAVVVALVAPALVLAVRIARQAPQINQALQQSNWNTLPLAYLRQTTDHAEVIIGSMERGRARLGGWRCYLYSGIPVRLMDMRLKR